MFVYWYINKPIGEIKNVDIVAAFSFGDGLNHGLSNLQIAKAIIGINPPKPVVAQWEVAEILRQLNFFNVISIGNQSDGYLPTWEIISKVVAEVKKRKCKKIGIICHSWHAWRVKQNIQKKISNVELTLITIKTFSKDSSQSWTKNSFFWIIREILTRIYCLLKGYI